MKTKQSINNNSGQFQTKDSRYHLSNAEIDRLAKEWVELLIDNIMCPTGKQTDNTSSPLSDTPKGMTVKKDD